MSITKYCPFCRETLGVDVGLHSGLGPSTVTCDVTGQRIRMDRWEWSEMGLMRRAWYCFSSLLYAAVFACWGILVSFGAVGEYLKYGNKSASEVSIVNSQLIIVGFAVFLATGVGLQINRVRRSLRRTAGGITLTHRAARFGLSGQFTTAMLMVIVLVAVVLGSKWINSQP